MVTPAPQWEWQDDKRHDAEHQSGLEQSAPDGNVDRTLRLQRPPPDDRPPWDGWEKTTQRTGVGPAGDEALARVILSQRAPR